MGKVIDNAVVFKFVMHFDADCDPMFRQERYVVALTGDEAMEKFHQYLERQHELGFQKPYCYSFYPEVEIGNAIV